MLRLTMVLVACVSFLPAANATLAPRKAPADLGKKLSHEVVQETTAHEQNDDLVITDQTEIKMDGRACKYEEVPATAEIVLLEVGSDKKAILKIHFQTKK